MAIDVGAQVSGLDEPSWGDQHALPVQETAVHAAWSSLTIRCGACRRAQSLETERLMLESGVFWRAVRDMPLNENAIVIGL